MQSDCPTEYYILTGCTPVTDCAGGSAGGSEGDSGEVMRSPSAVLERVRVCFSCGRPGHGVNRCSQVDTSFPFLSHGWSVDVRDGQYRAKRTGGTGTWSPPGNEGWSGREGQPPGSSGPRYD